MTRDEYSKAWNVFWRLPEVARLTPNARRALQHFAAFATTKNVSPPLIGVSDKTRRMIILWLDLEKDVVFDIAVYEDGRAEWYFRECRREIATYADEASRVPWFAVPTTHLDHFKLTIKG